MKLATLGVLLFAVLMGIVIRHEERQTAQLKREVHDLREYISAGCRGHYQGEGEQP